MVFFGHLAHVCPIYVLHCPKMHIVCAHFPPLDVKGPSLRLLEGIGGDLCPQASRAVQSPDVQVGANSLEEKQ